MNPQLSQHNNLIYLNTKIMKQELPVPAAVIACLYFLSWTSPAAKTPSTLVFVVSMYKDQYERLMALRWSWNTLAWWRHLHSLLQSKPLIMKIHPSYAYIKIRVIFWNEGKQAWLSINNFLIEKYKKKKEKET